jgi:hypothetical protein
MRVLKLTFGKKKNSANFSSSFRFLVWSVQTNLFLRQTKAVLSYANLAVTIRTVKWHVRTGISTGLRLAPLFLPYTHLCIFIDLSWHVVCFSCGFLPRFWHSLHISSHPMIFIVSFFILLSVCAFRILKYLLGYFLEIVCMKILLCLCVGVDINIYGSFGYIWVIWIAIFAFVILGHPIDRCHNTTFFLGLTGSNISLWCYF